MNLDKSRRGQGAGGLFHPTTAITGDLRVRSAFRLRHTGSGERQYESRKRELVANHCQIRVPLFSMRVLSRANINCNNLCCKSFREALGTAKAGRPSLNRESPYSKSGRFASTRRDSPWMYLSLSCAASAVSA